MNGRVDQFKPWKMPTLVALVFMALGWGILGATTPKTAPTPTLGRFLPDPTKAKEPTMLEGSTWVETGTGYAVRFQMIDEAQRSAYIEHVTGFAIDPFASKPEQPPGYLTFVVEIRNLGEASLSFNPRTAWLSSNRRKDVQSPFTLADLSFTYRETQRELPPAYQRIEPAILDHPRLIPPGEATSGLLIYKAVHRKARWLTVDLVLTEASGDIVRFTAPYRREPRKPGKAGPVDGSPKKGP